MVIGNNGKFYYGIKTKHESIKLSYNYMKPVFVKIII